MRNLLIAALALAASPSFAAGLTDFELMLQNALAQTDKKVYAEAVAKCDAQKGDANVSCWRPYLLDMAKQYTSNDGKVDGQNPENSFTPLERKIFFEIRKNNKDFDKLYTEQLANAKNPKNPDADKAKKFVKVFRDPLKNWMNKYVADSANFNTVNETTLAVKAMDQAKVALFNPEEQIDKNKHSKKKVGDDAVIVDANTGEKKKVPFTDDKSVKRSDLKTGVPPTGELEVKPEKAEDKNKWNDTIAGGKGALWAGMIALILGGPVGALVFGAIGFGVFAGISKMNNA